MLRSATLFDLEQVASWIATARDCALWAGWRVSFPIDQSSLPLAIGFSETNAFSLIDGDQLVAFGQLVKKNANRGHLARLIVNPSVRGSGQGKKLVGALLERARLESFERASLNVDASNLPAVSIYLKLGFRDATRPPDEPESAGTRYMEAPLTGSGPATVTAHGTAEQQSVNPRRTPR
jgi:ribosomal-protein-alanine N-acetyltransferase